MTHFLGGEAAVWRDVPVLVDGIELGRQKLRLAAPRVAFKLTALPQRKAAFAEHARRLLEHTDLEAILWANLTLRTVTFTTIIG